MNPGKGEVAMAQELLSRGLRPYRQFKIGPYFADLALLDSKIIIELDDPCKLKGRAKRRRQANRTAYIEAAGWKIIRVLNSESVCVIWNYLAPVYPK